jgi:tetratricopeptide (TPR) repeat protein
MTKFLSLTAVAVLLTGGMGTLSGEQNEPSAAQKTRDNLKLLDKTEVNDQLNVVLGRGIRTLALIDDVTTWFTVNPENPQATSQSEKLRAFYRSYLEDMRLFMTMIRPFAEDEEAFRIAVKAQHPTALQISEAMDRSKTIRNRMQQLQAMGFDLAGANPGNEHYVLALTLAGAGKPLEAQTEMEKAVEVEPASACKYYFNLGAVDAGAHQDDAVTVAFQKAIAADPKCAEAYFQLGNSLMMKATFTSDGTVTPPPGTVEAFRKYLQVAPNGPNAEGARAMVQALSHR